MCGFLAAGTVLALSVPSTAVVTFDLLQDTPETREALKEELGMASPPGQGPGVEDVSTAHDDLERIWFSREKFLQIGEGEKARIQLNLLWEKQMEKGIRNLPTYGEVLVREARRDIGNGKLVEAQEILSIARKLAPETLPAYFAAASLTLKREFWNLLEGGREIGKGAKAVGRSFRLQSWVAANLFFTASLGLLIYFAVVIGIMLMRNAGRIAHDIAEGFPRALSTGVRRVLGWLVFFLPLLVALPAWWWFILAGVALWPYVERLPRAILVLAMIFLFTLPWQVELASSLLSFHRQTFLDKVVKIREGHWTARDYEAVREMTGSRASDPLVHFVTGLAAKRLGRFEEARSAYDQALELSPRDAAIWNNLGNLALTGKEVDEAIGSYTRAIELDPGLFAPHYNLSLAYREKFLFPEGEKQSRQAVAIDPEANTYYTSIAGQHYNRYTVDELPSLREIWKMALQKNKWQKATADHLWMSGLFLVPRQIWPYFLGCALLFGILLGAYRMYRGPARGCGACGRTFCPRCSGSASGSLCSQCHHIFVRKQGVEARVKIRKMTDIQRRQKLIVFRRFLLALIVPGGGHLSAGRYGVGTFFALPATTVLAWVFVTRNSYPATWHLNLVGGPALSLTLTAGYALWWALNLYLSFRIEE
jgi:tetratricopeptide (TPR) repeat protein